MSKPVSIIDKCKIPSSARLQISHDSLSKGLEISYENADADTSFQMLCGLKEMGFNVATYNNIKTLTTETIKNETKIVIKEDQDPRSFKIRNSLFEKNLNRFVKKLKRKCVPTMEKIFSTEDAEKHAKPFCKAVTQALEEEKPSSFAKNENRLMWGIGTLLFVWIFGDHKTKPIIEKLKNLFKRGGGGGSGSTGSGGGDTKILFAVPNETSAEKPVEEPAPPADTKTARQSVDRGAWEVLEPQMSIDPDFKPAPAAKPIVKIKPKLASPEELYPILKTPPEPTPTMKAIGRTMLSSIAVAGMAVFLLGTAPVWAPAAGILTIMSRPTYSEADII